MLDTNERKYLLDSMKSLFDQYQYQYTDTALNEIIDEWYAQKGTLIEAFKKHPNYIPGKFMIAFSHTYERGITKKESNNFGHWIRNRAMYETKEYLPQPIKDRTEYYNCIPGNICDFFYYLSEYAEATISEDTANHLAEIIPEVPVRAGQKTTRVINKICTYLGFNHAQDYNKEFAKYADSLSPMKIKRHTILSVNPLDYLTMSFGNSWASCHTIDTKNARNMPNAYHGQYSSGTVSYMLDPSSMVFYTVDPHYEGDEYWNEPKINRQMFHYGEDKLVQGRLYPQSNDCEGDDIYAPYRSIVQEIMSVIFEFPNLWTLKRGSNAACSFIRSAGTHYRDYENFDNCTLSVIKGSENENMFCVGHDPICIRCGEEHTATYNIDCCSLLRCADCGRFICDESEAYEVDGETYCRGCVNYCDHCDEYHRRGSQYLNGVCMHVCDDCMSHYALCDECGRYELVDRITSVGNRKVCRRCIRDNYTTCDHCGQVIRRTAAYTRGGFYYRETFCGDCYITRRNRT